ncbi:MAG: tRNA uridine-5-carboxymethylaminomethyl(34) synthesis enzyme MnmG [Leptospirales bacterium]
MSTWDVVVVGGGHAGIEAASAASRMGCRTLLVTLHLDLIGQMSCNPSVGGIGKGHIVSEIEAMDGAIGKLADRSGLQFKLLNTRKGYAVQALRVQCDRYRYREEARVYLEAQNNLFLRQGEVVGWSLEGKSLTSLKLHDGTELHGRSFVLTTGTFLSGALHIGLNQTDGGRGGERSSRQLSSRFSTDLGLSLGRLKTGTPPRLSGRTINFSRMAIQAGDNPIPFFSHDLSSHQLFFPGSQRPCYLTSTNGKTRSVIQSNLDRSPLYSGRISGIGPRYCPSIEDKIVKFPERESHHVFIEPEGLLVDEYYPNGISTSLPVDVQEEIVHSISGLENAVITRPGYAVEYDFVFPDQLDHSLKVRHFENLFLAGQINGTTGYEEAAGQGLVAGLNAALFVQERPPWFPDRSSSYIGVMVDDLVTQGVDEPYRMFTSRAENRLYIRHHNADDRLTPIGRELGLVSDFQWDWFQRKREGFSRLKSYLQSTRRDGSSLLQLLKRPEVTMASFEGLPLPGGLEEWPEPWQIGFESEIKYEGYIRIGKDRDSRTEEEFSIPEGIFESRIPGLSTEILSRLRKASPRTFSEARSIRGMTPGALDSLRTRLKAWKSGTPSR